MNEIITMNSLTIAEKLQFKDERLSAATSEIVKIYQNAVIYADAKNRQIATILARVKADKSYIEDGFTSVSDYATKTFGIKKANAYALATAGEIYADENASEMLKSFTPSKLAEIATINREQLEEDVKSGKITATTTQKDLRNYAASHKAADDSTSTEVLDTYTARPILTCLNLPESLANLLLKTDAKTIEEWDTCIVEHINSIGHFEAEVIKLPKAPALLNGKLTKKRTINRRLYVTHDFSIVVEFEVNRPAMSVEKKTQPFTREQLMEMLKAMDGEDIEGEVTEYGSEG